MGIELVHIGFGNMISISHAVAIASPNSAPIQRILRDGKNAGKVINMSSGRKTKSVIFTDNDQIILAALAPETIAGRLQAGRAGAISKQEQNDGAEET